MTQLALSIFAADKGTRMKSDFPKVLHPIAGASMVVHAMMAGAKLQPAATIVVAGHGAEMVERTVIGHDLEARIVLQTEQHGTAHAVDQARDALADFDR